MVQPTCLVVKKATLKRKCFTGNGGKPSTLIYIVTKNGRCLIRQKHGPEGAEGARHRIKQTAATRPGSMYDSVPHKSHVPLNAVADQGFPTRNQWWIQNFTEGMHQPITLQKFCQNCLKMKAIGLGGGGNAYLAPKMDLSIPTPKEGLHQPIMWQNVCRKLNENERNWTRRGRLSLEPPQLALVNESSVQLSSTIRKRY